MHTERLAIDYTFYAYTDYYNDLNILQSIVDTRILKDDAFVAFLAEDKQIISAQDFMAFIRHQQTVNAHLSRNEMIRLFLDSTASQPSSLDPFFSPDVIHYLYEQNILNSNFDYVITRQAYDKMHRLAKLVSQTIYEIGTSSVYRLVDDDGMVYYINVPTVKTD